MKTYTGYRLPDDKGTAGAAIVTVHDEGKEPRPLDPRLDLRNHSPDGNVEFPVMPVLPRFPC